MGDAGGERSERGEPLCLRDARLERATLGDVTEDDDRERDLVAFHRERGARHEVADVVGCEDEHDLLVDQGLSALRALKRAIGCSERRHVRTSDVQRERGVERALIGSVAGSHHPPRGRVENQHTTRAVREEVRDVKATPSAHVAPPPNPAQEPRHPSSAGGAEALGRRVRGVLESR